MKVCLALGAALWLSACASPAPVVTAGPDPADPAAKVRPVAYRPVLDGTAVFEPVEPQPWKASNDAVRPGGKVP